MPGSDNQRFKACNDSLGETAVSNVMRNKTGQRGT